ncbi:MAG: ParB/RepB/Spo0J family partition protein [Candidatus Marinimicrobia bacterium]|nr:ParB/RepB/Spo0J family partition protein [Candidatus Neomarinimicrobiota bacterium]
MTVKRLGKGLSAIIPEFPPDFNTIGQVAEIDVDKIRANPRQPRKDFNEQAMNELKMSIHEKGIIQPITIRQTENGYELIAGERRLRAAIELGLKSLPAYILSVKTDVEMMELALIENVQREDLNPVDEAEAYAVLANTFNLSHEEIATKVGKDRSTITNSLRLLNLPAPIIQDLRDDRITPGHARPILSIENEKQQLNLWQRIKRDGLSVRAVEALVKNMGSVKLKTAEPKVVRKTNYVKIVEEKLMHIVGSRVKIRGDENKGSIEINFYSREDLTRLMDIFESIEDVEK